MSETHTPRLNKIPFWLGDAMLLVAAATLVILGGRPLEAWEMVTVAACVGLGAWIAVLPFLREYRATLALAETDRLSGVTAKLDQLETLAGRISDATGLWQSIQDRAHQTAEQARGVVDRLSRDAESFAAAVSRTADTEKQTMKLEVEKLRRGEGEWLQAAARVMDHVFALHLAAVRSGQPGVAEQIDKFHAACRDALRRVGFMSVMAAPDESFDPRKHQTADGAQPPEGARVDETLAPGFAFQGRLLRPVIVRLIAPGTTPPAEAEASARAGTGAAAADAATTTGGVPGESPATPAGSASDPVSPSREAGLEVAGGDEAVSLGAA